MARHHRWKQGTALIAAMVLALTPGLAGCGNKEKADHTKKENTDTKDTQKEEKTMGRYLEEDVVLPEDCGDIQDMTLLEDGTLRVCYYKGDGVFYSDSSDGGKSWREAVDLSEVLKVDTSKYGLSYPKLGAKGGIFVSAYDASGETEEHKYYYLAPDGSVKELDLSQILASGYVTEARFTDKGNLIINDFPTALVEINPLDGSVIRKYEEGSNITCFAPIGNYLVAVTNSTVHYYDLETGEPLEDAAALTEQLAEDEGNLELTSTSSYPLVFSKGDEEDSLFYAEDGGVYRYSFKGSVVEEVIDGNLNSLSSPDISLVAMNRDQDGNIYVAVQDSSADMGHMGRLLKYTYSPDTPAEPDTELTVYSLLDNSYIRQVAAVFQKKYPDIYLNLEVGMTGEDGMTTTDALKTLNTEIMAGNGPDVMILDGIPEDTYIEKGMLADISSILDKAEKEEGILDNIREPYREEDGSQYVMPLKFSIPLIQGNKEDVEKAGDIVSMADILESYQEEYTEMQMPLSLMGAGPEGFLRTFADVSSPAWQKEDGSLNEESVTEYLKQAGRIYAAGKERMDYIKEMAGDYAYSLSELSYLSNTTGSVMSLLAGYVKMAAGRLASPEDLANMYSLEQKMGDITHSLWNGQAQNCFIPSQIIGISAKAEQKDAAEKLVGFLFTKEGQEIGSNSGFPVNEAVYDSEDYWAAGDDQGRLGISGSGDANTGEYVELEIVRADEKTTKEIQELGKTLTTPSRGNEIILSAVAENGTRYLNGEISLEEAAKAAVQQVNLYLAE